MIGAILLFNIILTLIVLSFIDRWFFRKIVILSRKQLDKDRYHIHTKVYFFFHLIKAKMEFIEKDSKLYAYMQDGPYSKTMVVGTKEVQPRMANKALLKWKLENGF